MPENLGQDEYELLARIAHRYYADGRTQEEVARDFGLSRPKVQRLLERARWSGVVDIHIEAPPWLNLDLEAHLRETFQLSDAIVSPAREHPQARREEVARSAAQYLERRLSDGCVVAVSHGRDTGEVPRFFRPGRRLDCTFVSAMGGSPLVDAPTNPNEICRALAERSGGRAVSLYAPAHVESTEMRDRLLAQDAVADTLRIAAGATIALVGIGGTDDACTMVRSGCFSTEEIARLRGGERWATSWATTWTRGEADRVTRERPPDQPLHRRAAPDRDRGRGRQRIGEAARDPRGPACRVIDVLIVDEVNARAVLALAGATGGAAAGADEGRSEA